MEDQRHRLGVVIFMHGLAAIASCEIMALGGAAKFKLRKIMAWQSFVSIGRGNSRPAAVRFSAAMAMAPPCVSDEIMSGASDK